MAELNKAEKRRAGLPFALAPFVNRNQNLLQLAAVTAAIFALMSFLNPGIFLTQRNLESMSFQFPEFGLLALAIMLTMLTGGIDLAAVGTANLAGVLAALVLAPMADADPGRAAAAMVLVIALAAVVGAVCGAINGLLVAKVGIPAMLATLGTMQLFSGLAIVITKGKAVVGFPEPFLLLGNGKLFGLSIPLLVFVACAGLFALILNRTAFGFDLYLMGSNPVSARFSGIDNTAILLKTYMLSGLLSALAGIVIIARTNSAKADYGASYTLQAVVVAVMGGVNPNGGFGTVAGLILAILSLQFLSSGFNMLRIGGSFSNYAKEIVWGAVLLLVMVINYLSNRKGAKRQ